MRATILLLILFVVLSHASKTSLRHAVLHKVRKDSEDIDGDPFFQGDWSIISDPSPEELQKLKESLDVIENKIGTSNKEIMDELTKTRTCLSDKAQCSADVMGALAKTIPGLADAIKSGDTFQTVIQGGQTISAIISVVPGGQVWGAGIGLVFSLVSGFFGPSSSGPPPLTGGEVRSIVEQVVQLQADEDFFREEHQDFLKLREEIIYFISQWEEELDGAKGEKDKLNTVARKILDGQMSGKADEVGKTLFGLSITLKQMATSVQQLLEDLRKDKKGNIDKLLLHMCTKQDNPVLESPCLGRITSVAQDSYYCDHYPCQYNDKVHWTNRENDFWLPSLVDKRGFKGFCVKNNRARKNNNCLNFVAGCDHEWHDNFDSIQDCEDKVDRAEACEEIFQNGSSGPHVLFRQAILEFKGIVLRFMYTYARIGNSVDSQEYRDKLRLLFNIKPIIARWSQWSYTKACDDIKSKLYGGVHFPQMNSDGFNEYCNNRRDEWRGSLPLICHPIENDGLDLYDYHFPSYVDAVPSGKDSCPGCL